MCFDDFRPIFSVNIYMEMGNERLRVILSISYTYSKKKKNGVGKRSPGIKVYL